MHKYTVIASLQRCLQSMFLRCWILNDEKKPVPKPKLISNVQNNSKSLARFISSISMDGTAERKKRNILSQYFQEFDGSSENVPHFILSKSFLPSCPIYVHFIHYISWCPDFHFETLKTTFSSPFKTLTFLIEVYFWRLIFIYFFARWINATIKE